MFDRKGYIDFIASKGRDARGGGFAMQGAWPGLFDHQRAALQFACEVGRGACFLDTGLGKSRIEAAFAEESRQATGRPVLILTPLAVARQMQRECAAVDVEARVIRDDAEVWSGVNIANYERLGKLDVSRFGAVILDESSILKSFTGSTKRALVEAFAATPARLAATATPAPNDHMEIGQHSEFLGVMPGPEMLTRWFISDQTTMGGYRLKGHAKGAFWAWVASWARAAGKPSDLGGSDEGFIFPPPRMHLHTVRADLLTGEFDGLFRIPDGSATALHREKRLTESDRVARAAEIANGTTDAVIVWCETNGESAALTAAIPDAIEVRGSMSAEDKEAALDAFGTGARRVIVTKPSIAGFGLNWQHAATVVFASISHSYEQYYQALRRSWRFGQTRQVDCHVIIAETEAMVWENVRRKAADHDAMKAAMTAAMSGAQASATLRRAYRRPPKIELPAFMRQ